MRTFEEFCESPTALTRTQLYTALLVSVIVNGLLIGFFVL